MFKSALERLKFREPYTEDSTLVEDVNNFAWDQEADLVIAGFGGAGAAAALEAHDQGLTTIVLDRLSGGGATNISGGIYYAGGGTKTQQQANIEDSPENMFNYLHQEVQGAVSDKTLKKFCDDSVKNYDWICNYGVKFDPTICPFKVSFPPDEYYFYYSGNEGFAPYSDKAKPAIRGHRGHLKGFSGPAIYQPLRQSAQDKGVDIQTQSKVVSLLTNKDGDVIGLKAIQLKDSFSAKLLHKAIEKIHLVARNLALYFPSLFSLSALLTEKLERHYGTTTYIKANKGVVLATGGFFNNQAMVKQHASDYVGGSPLGTLTDDGSGIKMAVELGAKTGDMDRVSAWRFINPPTAFVKGILVSPKGKRICNEMLYGAQVGDQIMERGDGKGYIILDKKIRESVSKDLTLDKAQWFHVLLGYLFIWLDCKKADSIKELAAKLNIDPEAMQDTFDKYNVIANSDEPDPKGKPKPYMPPLGEGPYYAVNASYDYFYAPCPSLTLGGLKVNEDSGLVVREDDSEIKGLYAAGRTAVGIPTRGYVSGLSIADCIFSGRRAARHAAQV